ncbi:MAG: ZIP family metal transporter [Verrucomicrobiae bacterium]|nr:ZIP family metal transporter [Verrucomicrobiae bacterium]
MDAVLQSLLHALLAFALALAGGIISLRAGSSHQRLCALISLAAGTLLGVALFSILPEAWQRMRWWELALTAGSGYAVFSLLSRYVFHVCPACAASHFDEAMSQRFAEIATALVVALAVHCTVDGVALAAGRQSSAETDLSILLAIGTHKVPEGLALGALLAGAGFRPARALGWIAAVESTTLLGCAAGVWGLARLNQWWEAAVLSHAAGGFVFLAAHALLGELLKHAKASVLGWSAAGFVLIGVVNHLLHH